MKRSSKKNSAKVKPLGVRGRLLQASIVLNSVLLLFVVVIPVVTQVLS